MNKLKVAAIASIVLSLACLGNVQAQRIVFAELGGVQLTSEPVAIPEYPGYIAAKIVAKGIAPESTLVTFTNISISGGVVQTHSFIYA